MHQTNGFFYDYWLRRPIIPETLSTNKKGAPSIIPRVHCNKLQKSIQGGQQYLKMLALLCYGTSRVPESTSSRSYGGRCERMYGATCFHLKELPAPAPLKTCLGFLCPYLTFSRRTDIHIMGIGCATPPAATRALLRHLVGVYVLFSGERLICYSNSCRQRHLTSGVRRYDRNEMKLLHRQRLNPTENTVHRP